MVVYCEPTVPDGLDKLKVRCQAVHFGAKPPIYGSIRLSVYYAYHQMCLY